MVNRKGFTLIELTIVTQLLILLSAMIVPSLMRQFQVELLKKTALDIQEIQGAARNYYVDNDAWPSTFVDLTTSGVYLHANFDDENPFGYDYTFTSTTDAFSVSAQVLTDLVTLGKNLLPNTTGSGDVVTSTISIPGAAASSEIFSGDVKFSTNETCPSGYTRLSALDDRFLVGGSSYSASAGGSNTVTISGSTDDHTLTINEMPNHNHSYTATPWTGSRYDGHSSPLMTQQVSSTTGSTGGGQGHSHALSSISPDNRPEYATLVVCVKD